MNVALNHYAVMAAMFGLDIKGISAVSVPASDPHIAGLTADDLLGLDEIPKGKLRNEVSGSNCDGLVINNRESPVEVSK